MLIVYRCRIAFIFCSCTNYNINVFIHVHVYLFFHLYGHIQEMLSAASLSCLSSLLKFMIENPEDIFEVGIISNEIG